MNQATLYAGYDWRFRHFRKTYGYANMPLDGLWLRAPYLHNGSVPSAARSARTRVGAARSSSIAATTSTTPRASASSPMSAEQGGRTFFPYDTSCAGNGNAGHEGKPYGTELAPSDKDALVEYLKTF